METREHKVEGCVSDLLGAQVNRLRGPGNTGRKCLDRSNCGHLAEVCINMFTFCAGVWETPLQKQHNNFCK